MRKLLTVLLLCAIALVVAPADAKKRHSHKPAGVEGMVLNSTCPGACTEPPPPEPVYSGAVTITVQRASAGQQVAARDQALLDQRAHDPDRVLLGRERGEHEQEIRHGVLLGAAGRTV